jgi:hypothetical protein
MSTVTVSGAVVAARQRPSSLSAGVMPEIVQHCKTCLIVTTGASSLAEAMLGPARNPMDRDAMGVAGHQGARFTLTSDATALH